MDLRSPRCMCNLLIREKKAALELPVDGGALLHV